MISMIKIAPARISLGFINRNYRGNFRRFFFISPFPYFYNRQDAEQAVGATVSLMPYSP